MPSKSLIKNINLSPLQQHLSPPSTCHSLEIPAISKQQEFNQFPMDKIKYCHTFVCFREAIWHVTIGKNRQLQLLFNTHINTGVSCTFFRFFGLHYPCFFLLVFKISNMNRLLLYKCNQPYDVCLKDKRKKQKNLYLRGMSHLYGPGYHSDSWGLFLSEETT